MVKRNLVWAVAFAALALVALAGDGPVRAQRGSDAALEGRRQACRQAFLAHGIASCPTSAQNCASDCANATRLQNPGQSVLYGACVNQCIIGCGFQDPYPTGNPCNAE